MATKAGVWIDHTQAIVFLITDTGQETRKIQTDIEKTPSSTHLRNKNPSHDFVPEDRRERKLADDRKKVFDEVLTCIRGADALLILGPGEAKGEFSKHIIAKKVRGLSVELETTDKMTDRQLAAKVIGHFTPSTASKSVVRKKIVQARSKKQAQQDL